MTREDASHHVFDMGVKPHTGFILEEIAPIDHEIVWEAWTVRREKFIVGVGYRTPIIWLSVL